MPALLHIDCSEGISVRSLTKAVLSISARQGLSIEWLERTILRKFSDYVSKINILCNGPFFDIRFHESADVFGLRSTIQEYLEVECQDIPLNRGSDYTQRIMDISRGNNDASPSQQLESSMMAMCIFWWLDCYFYAQNISVSPIPVPATQMSTSPSLWTQLPVLITSTAPYISNDAVLLLRILLDLDKQDSRNAVQCFPPPMILTQHCNCSYHLPILHSTSISVGKFVANSSKTAETPMTTTSPLSSTLWQTDKLYMLEANIDDCTAEYSAFCVDMLLTRGGAADAWITSIVMKKGRAAHTIHCLCKESNRNTCLELLFRHSTTLGVRVTELDRVSLNRTMVTVTSKKWNSDEAKATRVDVKVGYLGEEVVSMKAEFDHCVGIAKSLDVPVRTIADEAVQLVKQQLERAQNPC